METPFLLRKLKARIDSIKKFVASANASSAPPTSYSALLASARDQPTGVPAPLTASRKKKRPSAIAHARPRGDELREWV
ncbi:hypothetical protein [Anatilimnocola aggregata]|uniref:hypothetical protein n=1 Tax=Anatilimnocola aggregata TaxID=2528021 RepID=UPI00192E42FD|nr:hypothetical protein [Anatilimnocola aggregata]